MATKAWTESEFEMDYEGNNAAFTCPHCRKIFIVSAALHPTPGGHQGHDGRRSCPSCRKSTGNVAGGRKSGGRAWIEF